MLVLKNINLMFDKLAGARGRCYANAAEWAAENKEGDVVHGMVYHIIDGRPILHAWVELGDMVIDPTIDARMPREKYYKLLKAEPHQKYSWEQAMILMIKNRHWGPYQLLRAEAQELAQPSVLEARDR